MKVLKEVRKNVHQQHFEDLVLFGKEGLDELNYKIENFINRFEDNNDNLNITTKIDGAPALFVWHHVDGYPDDSIALKGFVNGPKHALSSDAEIDAKYGDRPDMAETLKWGLKLAPYIPSGEAWQGDCLFTHDEVEEREIGGKNYLTFQPNKIIYAFSEENPGYNQVKNADFGIAFHTIYKPKNGEMTQGFKVDPTRINVPDNFYIMSPAVNAPKGKEDYSLDKVESMFNELKQKEQKLINDPKYEELVNNSTFMNYWNTFENANLADKKQVNININTFISELKDYIKDKQTNEFNKKLPSLKTQQGIDKATSKYNSDVEKLANIVDDNKSTLVNLVDVLNTAANIKMLLWAGFKRSQYDYSTFYKSKTKGYFPAEAEGIAMSDQDGNIVKLVDRSTFSSLNRDPDIESGFEHNANESLTEDVNDIKLDSKLEKLLGGNKQKFIDKVIEMILDKSYLDYFTYGLYRNDGNEKRKAVHDFWLNNFGLDTSLRGVGSKINSAILSIESSIEDTDAYKDSLDWDDTNRLPKDEQFKMNLFYEWDAIRKDPFGDYSDDDPRKSMSFREFLQDKLEGGDYEDDHEKQLLIKTIEEVKGGSGYFREMYRVTNSKDADIRSFNEEFGPATQMSDMGAFNKFIKCLNEDENKTAVIGWGRLNPPTIGHEKMIDAMKSYAQGEKAKLYLSHQENNPKNPLSYESKVRWCQKAFGDKVDVIETDAKTIIEVLRNLYEQGYTDIIYVGGEDRIGGDDDISKMILRYNGQPSKKGEIIYDFNSILFKSAGRRSDDSSDLAEKASASLARQLVKDDNFEMFKEIVPFNEDDAYKLFKELKYALK